MHSCLYLEEFLSLVSMEASVNRASVTPGKHITVHLQLISTHVKSCAITKACTLTVSEHFTSPPKSTASYIRNCQSYRTLRQTPSWRLFVGMIFRCTAGGFIVMSRARLSAIQYHSHLWKIAASFWNYCRTPAVYTCCWLGSDNVNAVLNNIAQPCCVYKCWSWIPKNQSSPKPFSQLEKRHFKSNCKEHCVPLWSVLITPDVFIRFK